MSAMLERASTSELQEPSWAEIQKVKRGERPVKETSIDDAVQSGSSPASVEFLLDADVSNGR